MQSEGASETPGSSSFRILAALLLVLTTSGCLRETRKLTPTAPVVLKQASLEDLTAIIERFVRVRSLRAVVDLQLTYVTEDRTKERILTDVRGSIVAQRPESIRVRAQVPVTKSSAFDMTSDGEMFKVYLAIQNRFFEGSTESKARSEKRSENIRPQHVLEPLLIAPLDVEAVHVLDPVREGVTAYYVVQEILPDGGSYRIARKFWFTRTDLRLSRLEIRDEEGELMTTARYENWTDYGGRIFPETATIDRPVDGYTLKITFIRPGLDEPPPDDAFVLDPPNGIKVERIEEVGESSKPPNRSS